MPIELGQYTIAILDNTENTSNIIETVKYTGQRDGDTVVNVPVVTGGVEPQPYYETQLPLTEYTVLDADAEHLVAHYKFDDDTNKGLNSAISTNSIGDASLNGTPTLNSSEYVIGKSSYFSGSGDHSFVLDDNSDNLYNAIYQKPITIAFWCKSLGGGEANQGRVFYGSPTGSGNNINSIQCWHRDGGNQLNFIILNNGDSITGNYMPTTQLPAFNTAWSHIVFVIEPQSTNWTTKEHTAKIYVNGVLDQTYTNIWYPLITQNYDFEIGRWTTNEDSREYNGYLDDFRIYDKALSPTEIGYLANKMIVNLEYKLLTFTYDDTRYPTIDADAGNLIAHYKFDGNFTDSSGNNNDAIPNGTGGIATFDITNKVFGNYSLKLLSDPSVYTYVSLPPLQFGDTVSISFWFNWNLATSYHTSYQKIIYLTKSGTGSRIFISRDNTNKRIYFTVDCDDKLRKDYQIFNTTIQDDTWYHIVWIIDNTYSWKVYVNSTYEAPSNTLSGTAGQLDTTIIFDVNYISRNTSNNWDGWFADFRIYDKVLTQEEINTLYNNPQTPYTLTFDNPTECDILIVAGGGGGGRSGGDGAGGGGGAGGLIYLQNQTLTSGQYTIKVGKGGDIQTTQDDPGYNGNDSSFSDNIAIGGGGGGAHRSGANGGDGYDGGSGGGGGTINSGNDSGGLIAGSGTTGQGNDGGTSSSSNANSGGGGGSGSTGENATTSSGGDGGTGTLINITGQDIYYAGGGGGGSETSNNPGLGNAGGGNGGGTDSSGGNALANTGSGGGGAGGLGNGGAGGSGIVIIRYKQQYNQVPYNAQWTYSSTDPTVYHYGNVGIGTIAHPSTALTIKGDVNVIGNYFNDEKMLFSNPWYEMDNKDIYKIVGNVGIGTHEPQYKLHIQRELYANNGGFSGNGSTSWSTTSDRRIKENVVEASYDLCFENIKNINLYKFNYAEKFSKTTKRTQFGFVAQEVQNYYPKAVQERKIQVKDNLTIKNLLTVDVTQLNYTLYGAVKHFVNEVDKIKSQLGIIDVVEEEPVTETTEEAVTEDTEEPVTNIDIV